MKRGAEQLISSKEKKIKTEQIQYVPNEIWQVIFSHLPPSFWGTVRQVSTGWRTLVQSLSRQRLDCYFSYLINHPDYKTQSLRLFMKEYQRYHQCFHSIPMDAILSVLEGNTKSILSESDPYSQKMLYGLRFSRGYPLPKKGLSEEDILEIKGWAIFFAAWQGNTQIFEELLVLEGIHAKYKNMALWSAAQNGHVDMVAQLVAHGVGVNTTTYDGATSVFIAAQEGRIEVIVKLTEHGADVNTAMNDGTTPIFIAAQRGDLEVVAQLVALGANVNTPKNNGATPVLIAAQNGHIEVIEKLVAHGADVNTAMNDGTTPVSIAAQNGHVQAIEKLVAHGANVNMADNDGVTPLYIAAWKGYAEVIAKLVELGADDVNTLNKYGEAPLHIAAEDGHAEAITKLVELGANVDTPNKHGETPVYIAARKGHAEVIAKLIELGANVDTPNNGGVTPTYIAAQNKHVDVIAQFIALGADINRPNNYGATPIFIAAQNGHAKVVQSLLSANVNIQPYVSSVGSLSNFAQSRGSVVIDRMNQFIKEKIEEGNPVEKIPLLPSEIAYIMGHDEIVNIFKTSSEVVITAEAHLCSHPPAMTFTFDAKKDSSSSSSEEGTMETDKNNHKKSFFSKDCC